VPERRPSARDPTVDVLEPERTSDRHAVAPIDHVIAVIPSSQYHRRQRDASAVGQGDPLPAVPHDVGGGPEAGIEVRRGLNRADDRAKRNHLQPRRAPRDRRRSVGLGGRAAAPSAGEQAAHPGEGVRPPSTPEIGLSVKEWASRGMRDG
jgi:hypothetical protein